MTRRVFACATLAVVCVAVAALAQTPFPLVPTMSADPDGTLHWSTRTIPLPALASAEARKRYIEILNRHLAVKLDGSVFVRYNAEQRFYRRSAENLCREIQDEREGTISL